MFPSTSPSERDANTIQSGALHETAAQAFNDLARLAATVCGTPIGLVTLGDDRVQRAHGSLGLKQDESVGLESFSRHSFENAEILIVCDVHRDSRFCGENLVEHELSVSFYAGVPLFDRGGGMLGVLSVADRGPRSLTPEQRELLRIVGQQVVAQLELGRQAGELIAGVERQAESEKRFRGIFDSTFNFIGLLAPGGVLLEANQTALDLIQKPADEVLGQHFADTPWWEHSAIEQVKLREGILRAALGETVRFETSHPGADAAVRYVDFTLKPIFDGSGNVVYLVPEGRDITERKLAEEKLAWLATFPVCNPNPIIEFDPMTGTIHYVNPTAERLFPELPAMGMGHPFLAGLEDPRAQSSENAVELVRREILLGEAHYAQIVIYVPAAKRFRVYGADITLRKKTEAALKASEQRYHSLFEHMLEGYCYCEVVRTGGRVTDFRYMEVNSAFEPLTNLKGVVGKLVSEVIPGVRESNPEIFGTYERVTSTGQPERYETFVEVLDIWFSVAVYSPDQDHFVAVFDNITERKRSAAAVEDVSKRLQLATLASGIGVWDWDLRTNELVWDERMFALYGLPTRKMDYKAWECAVHPEDLPNQAAILRETIRLRGRSERQFRIRRANDGAIRVIQTAEMIVTGGSGEPSRMVGVNRDVTDVELAAANLAASEELLRQFIKYTPAAIAMLDTQMKYVQASDRWLKDYRLEGREVIGHSHYEIFPDIPLRWKEIHQRVLKGAVERCDEDPFPRASGGVEWLQWEARPWRKAGGDIGGLVFYTQVITERKVAEAKMRESEERFRGAFDNAPIGMAMVGLDGRWLRVNRSLCEIVGRTESELLNCTFQDITHPEDLDADLEHVRLLIKGESEHYTMEKRYFHRKGHIVRVLLAVTVVRNAEGEPLHFVSQIEDITDRHEAATRMQASLEEKEVLLREIHHRVKNNLQVITSLLQLGSGYLRDPQDAEIFRECQTRIHAMGLVHDRLYRSGNLATIDFSEHLRELTTLIVRGQASVTTRIEMVVNSEPVEVNLDLAIPLGLIAAELITNAYKHAFRGRSSGLLSIELKRCADGRNILLRVQDDGVGLAADFQPDKARSLGLRLIRALAAQLRATFSMESTGTGSRMEVVFPIEE